MRRTTLTWVFVSMSVALTACTQTAAPPAAVTSSAAPSARPGANRGHDVATITRGAELFQEHCAACHGAQAEGAANWHKPGPDGKYPAPPLNGTAHDWHHPHAVLVRTIQDGTATLGGSMPAWRDKLGDAEINALIAWFQSLWPEEVFASWKRLDQEARAKAQGS